jgi:hypothetical protein
MPSVLSSDILEAQFGPTEVEILHQDKSERIICTKLVETRQVLEVSHVRFIYEGVSRFPEVHESVLKGWSMGKAFRDAGIEFRRNVHAGFKYNLPPHFTKIYGSEDAANVLRVEIQVGPSGLPYADILETYHPAVDWGSLKKLEPDQPLSNRIDNLDHFLATL